MKKLALVVAFAFISAPVSPAGSHLEVAFENYSSGPLSEQASEAHVWVVNSPVVANVADPSTSYLSKKVLSYFRPAGAVGGSVYLKIEPALHLDPNERIYFSIDVCRPFAGSTGIVALSNGAATSSPLFGLLVTNTGSLQVNTTNPEIGKTTRITVAPSLFKVNEGEWYRLEFEISPSSESGAGTFDLYVSSPDGASRIALLTSQRFSFLNASADRLYIIPNVDSETGGLEIGRLRLETVGTP